MILWIFQVLATLGRSIASCSSSWSSGWNWMSRTIHSKHRQPIVTVKVAAGSRRMLNLGVQANGALFSIVFQVCSHNARKRKARGQATNLANSFVSLVMQQLHKGRLVPNCSWLLHHMGTRFKKWKIWHMSGPSSTADENSHRQQYTKKPQTTEHAHGLPRATRISWSQGATRSATEPSMAHDPQHLTMHWTW